ncbi:MAG: alpha/beta hydrolase [Candidatus Methanomethylicus sp.]|nr:alpha/beta hydrolase [Candidatus Methanomethylicus sp.]
MAENNASEGRGNRARAKNSIAFVTEEVALRGRPMKVATYYPSQEGNEPNTDGAPYPLIAFIHGYGASHLSYTWLPERIVPRGYVMALISMPDILKFTYDLGIWCSAVSTAIDYSLVENQKRGGLLHGLIDPLRIGAGGHSMGGATTFLVAAYDERVKAAISFSPPYFGLIWGDMVAEAASKVRVPMLVGVGSKDRITPPNCAIALYDSLKAEKELIIINGGNHLTFTNINDINHALCSHYFGSWFDYYLKGDVEAGALLFDPLKPDLANGALSDLRFSRILQSR